MKQSRVSHLFDIYPTGDIPVPVCIGDLPLSDYIVSHDTLTENAAAHLQKHLEIPGVIITRNGRLAGVVPRHKMFERLGRRYGVELFLRKPIENLQRDLNTDAFALRCHLHINTTAHLALARPHDCIYDPVIVEQANGEYRLLDMYVLLLSQSQFLTNLSNVVSSLNRIEIALSRDGETMHALELILKNLKMVVPVHKLEILLKNKNAFTRIGENGDVKLMDDFAGANEMYRVALSNNHPLVVDDSRMVPAWRGRHALPHVLAWMGVPLSDKEGVTGLLSLSRHTTSPFTNNEKELAQVFSRHINQVLVNESQTDGMKYLLKKLN